MLDSNTLHSIFSSFPLVLFLLALILSLFAIFIKKLPFNSILLIIIALGCLAIYISIRTGDNLAEKASDYSEETSKLFKQHMSLSSKVFFTAILTLCLCLIQLLLCFGRSAKLYRTTAFVSLVFCLITSLLLFQLAKTGVELVYQHGVGVKELSIKQEKPATNPSTKKTSTQ